MAKTLADYDGVIFTSNEGNDFIIVQYLGSKNIEIEFIATGFRRWTRISDINAGKVRDMIAYDAIQKIKQQRKDAEKLQRENIKQKKREEKQLCELPKEWMKQNPYEPTVYGVGYYGNADKSLSYYAKARELWRGILRRCYSGDGKDDSYFLSASVCKRWNSLELFMDDLPNIIGFDLWASGHDMQLDKDLLSNQKIYAPETCIFLKATTNNQLQNKSKLSLARKRISQGKINYIPANKLNVKCWNGDWIGFLNDECLM